MSLDVYLHSEQQRAVGSGIFIREHGQTREITRAEWDERYPNREPMVVTKEPEIHTVYSDNITHNLGLMAEKAGIYQALWRPDENHMEIAYQLIEPLLEGLVRLQNDAAYFKQFNPPNGWGDYDGLVRFVQNYLEACQANPTATIYVSR